MKTNKKIHILYVAQSRYIGGAEVELMHVINGLDRKRYKPYVLFPCKGDVVRFFGAHGIASKIIVNSPWRIYKSQLTDFLKIKKIDIIHAFSMHYYVFCAAIVAKITGLPLVWHVHARLEVLLPYLNSKQQENMLCTIYGLSTRVVVCSRYARLPFDKIGLKRRVRIIKNGIDLRLISFSPPDAQSRFRKKCGVKESGFLAGMVSRVVPQKRPHNFIRAAALVKRRLPFVNFIIVGTCPSKAYMRQLKDLNRKNGNPVQFLGFSDNMSLVMNSLDILVLPSAGDAAALVILEAMACAKPVVAAYSGGSSEIVHDRVTGTLVCSSRAKAIAKAVIELAGDPRKAIAMGKLARKRAERMFDIRITVKRMVSIYDKLLSRRRDVKKHKS